MYTTQKMSRMILQAAMFAALLPFTHGARRRMPASVVMGPGERDTESSEWERWPDNQPGAALKARRATKVALTRPEGARPAGEDAAVGKRRNGSQAFRDSKEAIIQQLLEVTENLYKNEERIMRKSQETEHLITDLLNANEDLSKSEELVRKLRIELKFDTNDILTTVHELNIPEDENSFEDSVGSLRSEISQMVAQIHHLEAMLASKTKELQLRDLELEELRKKVTPLPLPELETSKQEPSSLVVESPQLSVPNAANEISLNNILSGSECAERSRSRAPSTGSSPRPGSPSNSGPNDGDASGASPRSRKPSLAEKLTEAAAGVCGIPVKESDGQVPKRPSQRRTKSLDLTSTRKNAKAPPLPLVGADGMTIEFRYRYRKVLKNVFDWRYRTEWAHGEWSSNQKILIPRTKVKFEISHHDDNKNQDEDLKRKFCLYRKPHRVHVPWAGCPSGQEEQTFDKDTKLRLRCWEDKKTEQTKFMYTLTNEGYDKQRSRIMDDLKRLKPVGRKVTVVD